MMQRYGKDKWEMIKLMENAKLIKNIHYIEIIHKD